MCCHVNTVVVNVIDIDIFELCCLELFGNDQPMVIKTERKDADVMRAAIARLVV